VDASAELKCPRCHKPVRAAAHFCPSCGYDLTQPFPADQATYTDKPAVAEKEHHETSKIDEMEEQDLLIVRRMGGEAQHYPLDKADFSIGRASDNDVVINHPAVSGHHLHLAVSPQGMALTDLHSTNGTQLTASDPAGAPHPVRFGDIVRIGDLTGNWVSRFAERWASHPARFQGSWI
jgi:hypothetical protein